MISEVHKQFWMILAFLYLRYGKFEKAKVLLEVLNYFFRNDPRVIRALSYVYLRLCDYKRALEYADRYLSICNENGDKRVGYLLKSKALWHLGEREEAREFMYRFVSL